MRLTKSQLEHLAQLLSESAVERIEQIDDLLNEEQWEDILTDLIPDIENALDRDWPNHIPPWDVLFIEEAPGSLI